MPLSAGGMYLLLSCMFYEAGWEVSAVKYMYGMFSEAISFNGELSGWDVSYFESMYDMFDGATFSIICMLS